MSLSQESSNFCRAHCDVLPAAPVRVAFADVLRGPAALIVVIAHLVFLHQIDPRVVALLTMASVPDRPALVLPTPAALIVGGLGNFGVALFFLISGFVIPMSLQHYGRVQFLVARFWRIYPTYLAGFLLGMAALAASAAYWGRPILYSASDIALNGLLVGDLFVRPDIVTVIWTLQIEVKFYLMAALLFRWIRTPTPVFLIGVAGALTLLQLGIGLHCGSTTIVCWQRSVPVGAFAWEGTMIVFMLIGTAYYGLFRGLMRPLAATMTVAVLLSLFFLAWRFSLFADAFPTAPLAYCVALAVFAAAFAVREHIRHGVATRLLSAISYPLYVVHPLVGYVTIRLLGEAGVPLYGSIAVAFVVVFTLAVALHRWVEGPTLALGKRLAASTDLVSARDGFGSPGPSCG